MTHSSLLKSASIAAALSLVLAACTPPAAQTPSSPSTQAAETTRQTGAGGLKVVATFSIIGDFVHIIGGDLVELTTLVGPDSDVHDFEPAPSHVTQIAAAQLIFENGLDLETWLDPLYGSSASKATRVVLSEGIQAREADEPATHEAEGTPGADAHAHGEFDPHIWQNVQYAKHMVGRIATSLAQADAAHAAIYTANAAAYQTQLDALDAEVKRQVETLPSAGRKLVTSHDALGYYADRYGFKIVGDVLGSISTEASEPTAQDMAALIDTIKAQQVKAIFIENTSNPQLVERVAQEAGVIIGPALYTDALGPAGSPGATYIDAIRHNTSAIVGALK